MIENPKIGGNTMKKPMKLVLVLLSILVFTIACEASAASKLPLEIHSNVLWENEREASLRWMENVEINWEKMQLISIKSSKPKVIKAIADENGLSMQSLATYKPGKSKLTLTYKYKNKRYKTSAVYTVKKYPNPIRAIYVNGRKVKLKKKSFQDGLTSFKKSKAKVKLVPSKGWSISETSAYSEDNDIAFKNGGTVKIAKKKTCYFYFMLRNQNGELFEYEYYIAR